MSKPLFFTGRKDIARADVSIRLVERLGRSTQFEASIDLARYGLPADSLVVVEAYHNAYLERFPCGTVSALDLSARRELKGLDPGDRPHFRVKVIASNGPVRGRLLAAIDEVRPETEDGVGEAGSLLPIIPKTHQQMGDEFWRVHFLSGDERLPQLWVNRDVHGLFAALQNQDPKVTGLIMPEVLRQVLCGLVADGESWTEDGRLGRWLEFAQALNPDKFEEWDQEDQDVSRQKRRDWVDEVVRRFAKTHRFFARYHEQGQSIAGATIDD